MPQRPVVTTFAFCFAVVALGMVALFFLLTATGWYDLGNPFSGFRAVAVFAIAFLVEGVCLAIVSARRRRLGGLPAGYAGVVLGAFVGFLALGLYLNRRCETDPWDTCFFNCWPCSVMPLYEVVAVAAVLTALAALAAGVCFVLAAGTGPTDRKA
jgi:hypothetical protein